MLFVHMIFYFIDLRFINCQHPPFSSELCQAFSEILLFAACFYPQIKEENIQRILTLPESTQEVLMKILQEVFILKIT